MPWRAIPPIARPDATVFSAATIARGQQLAALGDCAVCHTSANGILNAGGKPLATPFGTIYSTNITPDVETGIGAWSYPAFERAMREGIHRDGRHLYPAFPYTHFARTTDADMQALYAYLMAQPAVRASIEETIASSFETIGEYTLADAHFQLALAAAHATDGFAVAQPRLLAKRSKILEDLGHYQQAHTLAQHAVTLASALAPDDRARLVAEGRLASNDCVLFRHKACRERFARVYAADRRVFGENDPETLSALSGLANASIAPGSYEQAKTLVADLLQRYRSRFGADHSQTLKAVRNMALIEINLGEQAEAEKLLRTNLPIAERALGSEHQTTAEMVFWLGESLRRQKRYTEAKPLLERAFALLNKINGPHHFMTLSAQHALVALLVDMGDDVGAEQNTRALVATMQTLPDGHGDHGAARLMLVKILVREKRFAEAESELNQAWSAQNRTLTQGSGKAVDLISSYIALYAAWNKPQLVAQWRAKLRAGVVVESGLP